MHCPVVDANVIYQAGPECLHRRTDPTADLQASYAAFQVSPCVLGYLRHSPDHSDIVNVDSAGPAGLGAVVITNANDHLFDRSHVHTLCL